MSEALPSGAIGSGASLAGGGRSLRPPRRRPLPRAAGSSDCTCSVWTGTSSSAIRSPAALPRVDHHLMVHYIVSIRYFLTLYSVNKTLFDTIWRRRAWPCAPGSHVLRTVHNLIGWLPPGRDLRRLRGRAQVLAGTQAAGRRVSLETATGTASWVPTKSVGRVTPFFKCF